MRGDGASASDIRQEHISKCSKATGTYRILVIESGDFAGESGNVLLQRADMGDQSRCVFTDLFCGGRGHFERVERVDSFI